MENNHSKIVTLWALVAACGCMDIGLLDDMVLVDTDTFADGDADSDTDSDSDTDGDTGPPETDPDDVTPPGLGSLSCGAEEYTDQDVCVAVGNRTVSMRLATDEPARVELSVPGELPHGIISVDWAQQHHGVISDLTADTPVDVTVSLSDINGNLNQVVLSVTGGSGDPVSLTEVLADPLGAEPAQEFVEIVNYGLDPVDIGGWMIDDNGDWDGDLVEDGTVLAPGQVAVLVSSSYDPFGGDDPGVDPAALIIYLDSSIGTSGLKNSEAESVELYDAMGVLVSSYQGQAGNPKEGKSAARLLAELPDGDSQAWPGEAGVSSTPGVAPTLD